MKQIHVALCGRRPWKNLDAEQNARVSVIKENFNLYLGNVYITVNGKLVQDEDLLENGQLYHVVPRVLGGKGGFGSMLRALGAQIEKTTNREACRDLSGRRMRDVNNAKQLQEWVNKEAEREKERDRKRQERLERRRAEPRHQFEDQLYHQQKAHVLDNLEDALQQGLQRSAAAAATPGPSGLCAGPSSTSRGKKRTSEETAGLAHNKRARQWLGVENLSDLDTDSDSDDNQSAGALAPHDADSGTMSEPHSGNSEADGHSDSGVESVEGQRTKVTHRLENMDIDTDSSPRDSALLSDSENNGKAAGSSPDMMQTNGSTTRSCGMEAAVAGTSACTEKAAASMTTGPGARPKTTHGLLSTLPPLETENQETIAGKSDDHDDAQPIKDLEQYASVAELEALGLDVLKATLTARGLKCGGTLQQRAERLFLVRGLSVDKISPSLFAKPAKGKKKK